MGLFNFPQVDSNVNVIFSVDGDEYAVEQFKIGFHQPVDNLKNQPEGEVRGGRIMITLSQTVKSNIYGWAVKPWVKKNGAVLNVFRRAALRFSPIPGILSRAEAT